MQTHPVIVKIDDFLKPMMGDAPEAARLLGAAGLIPFVFFAFLSIFLGGWVNAALTSWGALVLAGLGMTRFGFASAGLGDGPDWRNLIVGVSPTIYAWLALILLPDSLTTFFLALGFGAMQFIDMQATKTGAAPVWWAQYRLPLTAGAAVCLLIGTL